MPFVPAPNIVQCEIRMQLDGQRIENRIMIDCLQAVNSTAVTECANFVRAWCQSTFALQLPEAVSFREVYCKGMDSPNGFEATAPFVDVHGAMLEPPLPNNVTICASLRTGQIGRSARGRFYWPCLAETQVDGNTVNQAALTNISTALNALKSEISDHMFAWVVVSYRHNNAPRTGGPVYFVINNITFTDDTVDSQRRRLPGRGR